MTLRFLAMVGGLHDDGPQFSPTSWHSHFCVILSYTVSVGLCDE